MEQTQVNGVKKYGYTANHVRKVPLHIPIFQMTNLSPGNLQSWSIIALRPDCKVCAVCHCTLRLWGQITGFVLGNKEIPQSRAAFSYQARLHIGTGSLGKIRDLNCC